MLSLNRLSLERYISIEYKANISISTNDNNPWFCLIQEGELENRLDREDKGREDEGYTLNEHRG